MFHNFKFDDSVGSVFYPFLLDQLNFLCSLSCEGDYPNIFQLCVINEGILQITSSSIHISEISLSLAEYRTINNEHFCVYFFCQGSDWYLFVFHSHIRTRTIDKRVKYNIGGFIHLSKFFTSPPPYLYGIPPNTVLSQSKWPFQLSMQPTLSFNLVSRYILMLDVSDETLFLPSYFQKKSI